LYYIITTPFINCLEKGKGGGQNETNMKGKEINRE